MLDPLMVVAGGHRFRMAACDHLTLDGVSLKEISLERVDGVQFGMFDVGGVRIPLHGARYLVLTAGVVPFDLREPPTEVPACSGHIGELLI